MKKILIFLVNFYKIAISTFLPKSCRFTPSCSEYTLQALKKYPVFKALKLSAKRILKCHPFSKGGNDPLP